MNFEWDENKRRLNIEKRGLDFEDAKEIFSEDAFIVEDNRKNYGEIRYILYGYLCSRLVILVFTKREKNIIRIISMRKANKREQNGYKKRLEQNRPDVG